MMTVSPRRIPCRICGEYTPEQMVYGTFRTGPRPGFLYDPQDLTTLYQDAQGTLPVYRPGTGLVDPPMGLMLDKSRGLELGPEGLAATAPNARVWRDAVTHATYILSEAAGFDFTPGTYRIAFTLSENLCTSSTGAIRLSGGSGFGASPCVDSTTPINVEQIAYVQVTTTPSNLYFAANSAVGVDFTIATISAKKVAGYHAYQTTTTARPTLSGRYNLLDATETLSTQSVTTEATNYTLSFSGTGTITLSGTATGTLSAGTHTIPCTAGTLTCAVAGTVTRADLRRVTAQTLPAYQSVTDANTYDTAGFPLYLRRDLIDDEMLVSMPAMTGQRVAADFDEVASDAVTIAAGEHKPFGAVDAGPAECTQLLVVAAPSADEITVFERFAAEKCLLPGGV